MYTCQFCHEHAVEVDMHCCQRCRDKNKEVGDLYGKVISLLRKLYPLLDRKTAYYTRGNRSYGVSTQVKKKIKPTVPLLINFSIVTNGQKFHILYLSTRARSRRYASFFNYVSYFHFPCVGDTKEIIPEIQVLTDYEKLRLKEKMCLIFLEHLQVYEKEKVFT